MNWREEYAKSLMTLANLALVGLFFNGILNPNIHWWHYLIGFAWYGISVWASWLLGLSRGGGDGRRWIIIPLRC
jgi:hypothetical protein